MNRYVLEVRYDGTQFHGSQLQGDLPTVQLVLNQALATLLRTPVESFGASRTDEGVHALSNYYHFDYPDTLADSFLYNFNAILPPAVAARRLYLARTVDFNARFDAVERRYRYRIYRHKDPFLFHRALYYPFSLDVKAMEQTAALLTQYTHFESFSKRNTQTRTFECAMRESRWVQTENELQYTVAANRFLRGMVRGLVATQLRVGRHKMSLEGFKNIIEAHDCTRAFFNVDGHGLYLEQVVYPEGLLDQIQ